MIPVTKPQLPPLEEFNEYLIKIWDKQWLTNNGPLHQELEEELCKYLGVKYISLFANGTMALITAIQALNLSGEVITTPYSFVATTHSLWWNNIKPVFVDIEPTYLNIDPNKIEAAITPKTTGILPVHVYGNPCEVDKIEKIAETYGLKVLYDAAHAFGTKINNNSILNFGDLSILSFHATKVYSTIEGGAIISHTKKEKDRIDKLKNFGFEDEITVLSPGINAKLNEIQAAYGLLQLKYVDQMIKNRENIDLLYRKNLADIKGIHLLPSKNNVSKPYSYFPILIDKSEYGKTRDELYEIFKSKEIFCRRYFYPLISNFPTYKGLESSSISNLSIANKIANEVLCLPMFSELELREVEKITQIIKEYS
ncbi:DegT/DnrJ/EryC1/StrS family aminotransferase [Apibacter muscae]|uniref:DegT/DnrJ/EryC1/StrS family aminotransferase n=1 Tax=Apibacter muscae TaxID=2509004 RepID=UPI0011ACAE92|nr:DegT/DnrJ/EryC1/StrS family aminotransferase [Apibacter muscae]TWP22859.1 DegT/DnrJ/EryC1/StrS family aminotransferase [Apibacter muscae]